MPKAYVIGQVNFKNIDAYKKEYADKVPTTIEKFEGKYIVRGGEITDVEGSLPFSRVVIIEFPSKAKALEWYNSIDYQSIIKGRHNNADSVLNIVEGI